MSSTTDQFKEKYPHMTDKEILQLVKLHNRELKAKEQQKKLRAKASGRIRKARTKMLCDIGGLVLKARLENMDKATLLGALLSIKKVEETASTMRDNQQRLESWKMEGTRVLSKKPVEVNLETSTPSEPEEVIQKPFASNKASED